MAMSFKDIDTVLFDFDGTLADTERLILDSWQETFMEMKGERAEADFLRGTFGEPLVFSMKNLFPEEPQRAVNIYRAYNEKHFLRDVELFPGMLESLRGIKSAGLQTGLVTARLRRTTFMGLEKFDMVKDFDVIVTEEDCSKSKPDPAPMFAALEQLAKKKAMQERGQVRESGMVVPKETIEKMASRTVYVGDTIHDLGCANHAGVKCVLVGWSPTVKREQYVLPGESNPQGKPVVDAILQKGTDLPALLGLSC